jgi:NADPH-dependent curcumin reductase CurA
MPETNRQVRLKSRPNGIPQAEHFEIAEEPLAPLAEGRFRVRNRFLSVDPAMRGWVSAEANYSKPVGIGEVMRAFAVGEVVESRHPGYAVGEQLMGMSAGSTSPPPTAATPCARWSRPTFRFPPPSACSG